MEPHALASQNGATSGTSPAYDSQTGNISNLPARPPKVQHAPHTLPTSSRFGNLDAGYPAWDEKHAQSHPRPLSPVVPGTSVSSAGGTSVMTGRTIDTIDLEKAILEQQSRKSGSRTSSRRKARQEMAERNQSPNVPSNRMSGSGNSLPLGRASVSSDMDEEQHTIEQRRLLESKALNMLLFLSGPCAALSFLLCFYSIFASLAIFLVAPIRLCAKPRSSLWEQMLSALTSAQRLQLRCIYAPTANLEGKCVASLLLNLVVSPFLSIGVALAAWIVAIYWIFAAIVGDPDGTEGGDDGRATVLVLRGWWEGWLLKAVLDD